MDLDDIAEFTMLKYITDKKMDDFMEVNKKDFYINGAYLSKLLMVYYLHKEKGSCWEKDLLEAAIDRGGNKQRTSIIFHRMYNGRLVTRHDRSKILGYRFEVSNKGMHVLRQYTSWVREEQRKYHYKLKVYNKEHREFEEKS